MIDFQPNEISISLKKYFSEKGLTQKQIADKLEISQAAVGRWLNGKPFGKKTAARWSEVFGLNPSWLLTGTGQMLNGESGSAAATGDKSLLDLVQSQQRTIEMQAETIRNLTNK